MDRRNGGDPLAPPRPPKLLPRVHRPRAPEPAMMSDLSATAATTTTTTTTLIPQCTNISNSNNNTNSRHSVVSSISHSNNNNNNNNNSCQSQQQFHSINDTTNLSNSNNNHTVVVTEQTTLPHQQQQQQQQQQHHHHHHLLTTPLLQLHRHATSTTATTNLSRTNSSLSSASSTSTTSSTLPAANSFTRRRPPPPTPTLTLPASAPQPPAPLATAATSHLSASSAFAASSEVPLLTVVNGNILSGSFLLPQQHLQLQQPHYPHHYNPEPVPVSPVTLAAPRPESERLTNEYVDTPFRTAQQQQQQQPLQLQHASRAQHPAGQNVHGQTTTHHSLLLQQSQTRQQQQQHLHHQQQHHQQQQHSSRVGTAGSATTSATAAEGRGGAFCDHHANEFLHSNSHKTTASATATATMRMLPGGKTASSSPSPLVGQASHPHSHPPPPPARPSTIAQPSIVTKQPASSSATALGIVASHAFTKDPQHPAFTDDILDLHHVGGLSTPPGSHSNGGALGSPVAVGSDAAALNPITCPRCDRCRCEQCQSPRQLPQTWVCNKTCLCSAETIIDYASCLCCVKALFYHCAKDHELDCDDGATTLCVDDPCSCLPHKRAQRWGWLGALSLVLPCLWCYWPMRGCAAICEKCYGRYAGQGCRCQQIGSTSSMLPIVPLGLSGGRGGSGNGVLGGGPGGGSALNGSPAGSLGKPGGGVGGGGHHQRHHTECSATSRILRKCDLTPEKRLLDSSPEY